MNAINSRRSAIALPFVGHGDSCRYGFPSVRAVRTPVHPAPSFALHVWRLSRVAPFTQRIEASQT